MLHFRDIVYSGFASLSYLSKCPFIQNPGDYKYAFWVLSMRDIPATLEYEIEEYVHPDKFPLYCMYKGVKYKVIRGSNLGDILITSNLTSAKYNNRVPLEELEQFSNEI